MKQTEISKVRGWWKHLMLLCVTLLGVVGFSTAQNYPFPQNYQYPYGNIYKGANVGSKIQELYTAWKQNYYVEGTVNGKPAARIKFDQHTASDDGTNSVSEGIAYGMLIFVYMDNSTNNTQDCFNRLWTYYKENSNNNGLMNWKVNAFTGKVTAGDGNANGATDADLDAAQALLMAHKQWGSDGKVNYLQEAKTLINAIWNYEISSTKQVKPGDMFDDYKNPCYFITNAMQLFAYVEGKEGWGTRAWSTVINNCYTLMAKTANSTTGLIPDWCYENGTYLKGLINGKFESIFGYDAVRIPWRLAHAYAWYGHAQAQELASKITSWAQSKYPNPDDIVDGYQLNGTPGTGGMGGSLATWGTGKNACFKGGLSVGSMVDDKFSAYMEKCWSVGSANDAWGAYYTHTTQLLFMMCLTGNMPNFWDMLPVPDAAETNADGTVVYVDFSKEILNSGLAASEWRVQTYENNDDATATTISVSKIAVSSSDAKRIVLTLSSEISEPVITVTYNGTSIKAADDKAKADAFSEFEVANKITSMEPYVVSRYTNDIGTKLMIQWSKEIALGGANASDFTVFVDGTSKGSPASINVSETDADVLELVFDEAYITSAKAEVTVSFAGGAITSTTGKKTAKAFTKSSVQNFYLSVQCFDLLNAATETNIGFGGSWAGAGSFSTGTQDGTKVYTWSNKGRAYACLQTYPGDAQAMSAGDLAAFQEITSKSGLRLKGRVFLKSMEGDGLQIQINDMGDYGSNYGVIDCSDWEVGKWNEFDYNFSDHNVNYQKYNPGFEYSGVKIRYLTDADNGSKKNYEIYIDYLQLCPPNPTVEATSGKVSFDGKQVELKFSTGMRVPSVDPCSIQIYADGDSKTIVSAETKVGDATTLVLTLEEPIDKGQTVYASYASYEEAVKSLDGRLCEDINVELANLVGMTVATGWFDHFDDESDYVTYEIAGDGKIVTASNKTENAAKSILAVTQKETESWAGALTISTKDAGYVIDMSGRETLSFKVSTASGTMTGYYRIDFVDYFGKLSEGDWIATTISTSGLEVLNYSAMNFEIVDRSAIEQVLFRFVSDKGSKANDYTPTFYGGTLNFDYISVGKALTLKVSPADALDQSVGVAENSTIVATSSANGYIYVVPFKTTPQFSELEAAVVNGEGVKVACTEDTETNVSLEGIGYGYFYVYAYDPDAGALSSKVAITVNDVTAPEILECTEGDITKDGSISITCSENSTVYVVLSSATGLTGMGQIADVAKYNFSVSGGEAETVLIADMTECEVGETYAFYAMDASYNVSEMSSCKFTIKAEKLKIENVYTTDEDAGPISAATSKDVVTVMANRPFTNAYLVLGSKAVSAATIASVADISEESTGLAAELNLSTVEIDAEGALGHIYITDGESLVGPYDVEITKGTVYVTALSTEVDKQTVKVGEEVSVKVVEDPLNATNKTLTVAASDYATFEYSYDSEKNINNIVVTGVKSTAGEYVDMVISAEGETGAVTTTVQLKVVQMPTVIAITGEETMSVGSKQTLKAEIAPADAEDKTVTWSVPGIAAKYLTIDSETGEVTALKESGDPITVTATSVADETVIATFEITVAAVTVNEITTSGEKNVTVVMDKTASRLISVAPANATNKNLTVVSADSEVATAEYAEGNLTISGVGVGTTTITLTPADGGKAELVFNVTVTCPTAAPTAEEVSQSQEFCQGTAGSLEVIGSWTPVWYTKVGEVFEVLDATPATTASTPAGSTTYYVAKLDGCESAERLEVAMVVAPKPQTEIGNEETEFCATENEVELKSSYGSGIWTAKKGETDVTETAISGNKFLPSVVGDGTYTITLTRGTDACGDTDSKVFTVTAAPEVTVTVPEKICSADDAIALTTVADPNTGSWKDAKNETVTSFDPSNGSATLTYTYVDGACSVVKEATFTVTTTPAPAVEGLKETVCANDAEIDLSKLTFSPATTTVTMGGSAITTFNPATATVGANTLVLTATTNGCEGSTEKVITVNAVPEITFGSYEASMCSNDAAQTITAEPAEGTWSGNAPAGVFDPAGNSGVVEISYSVVVDGCKASKEATITVNETVAPEVTAVVGLVLGADVPTLSAEGTTIMWYTAEDGEAVASTSTYTPSITTDAEGSYKVYVTNTTVAGCESDKETVTITVTDCKTAAVTVDAVEAICFGAEIPSLTATGDGSSEIRWYDAKGTKVGTGETFTPTIEKAGNYNFFAAQYSEANACEGIQTPVTLTVKATPAKPVLTANESCAGAAANALTSSDNVFWYGEQGTQALNAAAAKTYSPADLEATKTFYARTELNGCYSEYAEVVYTINETPAAPETAVATACYGSSDDYVVSATASTGCTLQWYDAEGNTKGTEATQAVTGVTAAKDYTYTVKQKSEKGCVSAAAEAVLTVNAIPTPAIELSQSEYCQSVNDEIELTANNNGFAGTGVFKVNDVVKSSFVPNSYAINDVLKIDYTLTDENGCAGSAASKSVVIVNCNDDPVDYITVAPTSVTLKSIGAEQTVKATVFYGEGTEGKYNSAVAWTSDNEEVATVDQSGKITAAGVGTANITVKSTYTEGKSAVCVVTVVVPVTSVSFTENGEALTSISLGSGQSKDLSGLVSYEPAEAEVTYSWTATAGLTVSEAGVVTAEETLNDGTGTVMVTVTTADGTERTASLPVTIVAKVQLVESITLKEGATLSLQENATYTLKAPTVSQATDMSYTWSIDGDGATIEGNVITVTGKSGDTFKVVCSSNDGNATAECVVTIVDQIIPASSLSFSAEGVYEVYASGSVNLRELLVIEPEDATIESVKWSVGTSAYATITDEGVFTGVPEKVNEMGIARQVSVTVTVTSTDGSVLRKQQTVKVNPDPMYVESITIPSALSIEVGGSYTFKNNEISIAPLNADNKEYVWVLSENAPATISEEGEISVNSDATIGSVFSVKAIASDAKGVESNECQVTVLQETVKITGITIDVEDLSLEANGRAGVFYVTLLPENTTQTRLTVTSNSDAILIEDNEDGSYAVKGLAGVEEAEIVIKSADNASISKTVKVSVVEKVTSVKVRGSQNMVVGETMNLSVTVTPETATNKIVAWSSSDESVATVTAYGTVVAKHDGYVTITAKSTDGTDVEDAISIYVEKIPVEKITSKDVELELNQTKKISVTIAPSNASYKDVNFIVSDNSILSVDSEGNITPLAMGETTVTIMAVNDNVEETITVKVTAVRADKNYLIQLIENETWGAYSVYNKVQSGDIMIGWAKGQISPLVYNEFQSAWMDAQTVRYEDFATQEAVDAAAKRLLNAIKAMGEDPDIVIEDAIEDVVAVNAKVYPTFVTNVVMVEADNMKSVKVVSTTGKVVAQEEANGDVIEINAARFAQGNYKVIVETENGIVTKSFIKK
ncbi:MAG: glycosyl hydrolase family 8 [Bacteroidales bacterium]|nr:glycosyl hydrolase family 8 [Bacteroidales bacterium]